MITKLSPVGLSTPNRSQNQSQRPAFGKFGGDLESPLVKKVIKELEGNKYYRSDLKHFDIDFLELGTDDKRYFADLGYEIPPMLNVGVRPNDQTHNIDFLNLSAPIDSKIRQAAHFNTRVPLAGGMQNIIDEVGNGMASVITTVQELMYRAGKI